MKSKIESRFIPPILLVFYSSIGAGIISPLFHLLTVGGIGILCKQLWDYMEESKRKGLELVLKGSGLTKTIDDKEFIPKVIKIKKTDYSLNLTLSKPPGLTLEDFQKKKESIKEALGKEIEFSNHYQGKHLILSIFNDKLKEKYTYKEIKFKNPLTIPIGISNAGPINFTFGDQYVHLLVGGTTGSGKGNFLMQAITNLILNNKPEDLQIYIIDLKKAVEAQIFKRCEIVKDIAENEDETFKLLCKIEKEMNERYNLFKKVGVINIKDYKKKLPKLLIVIDELANIRNSKRIKNKLIDLLSQSRATGIHFILSTQRPDSNVIDGLIKANTQATIALSCRNRVNSQILLDNDDAMRLNIPGRAIFQTFKNVEVQVYYLSEKHARFLLTPFYINKIENKINTSGVVNDEETNNNIINLFS
jgi:S-DNA-T family DNA segregation ATPase FtsK/SpoIIIE